MQDGLIFGVDPGPAETGWVLWNPAKKCVVGCGIDPNAKFLETLRGYCESSEPIRLYVEMIACYGMAVGKETFETVLWIGRFIEVWSIIDWPWQLCYRIQIKTHHCHSAKAKDSNVSQAIRDKYGGVGTKKAPGPLFGVKKHIWSALAIATYAVESGLACTSRIADPVPVQAPAAKPKKPRSSKA